MEHYQSAIVDLLLIRSVKCCTHSLCGAQTPLTLKTLKGSQSTV